MQKLVDNACFQCLMPIQLGVLHPGGSRDLGRVNCTKRRLGCPSSLRSRCLGPIGHCTAERQVWRKRNERLRDLAHLTVVLAIVGMFLEPFGALAFPANLDLPLCTDTSSRAHPLSPEKLRQSSSRTEQVEFFLQFVTPVFWLLGN